MKRLLSLTLLSLTLFACKKEKDEPVLTTVDNALINLTYKEENGIYTENWFSGVAMDGLDLPAINTKPDIQSGLLFGYYRKVAEYGFYSPEVFPIQYGQENWQHKPSPVTFKKATIDGHELYEVYPDGIPVQVILDAWNKGVNPRNIITHPHEGEIYAFATADGKCKGIVAVKFMSNDFAKVTADIWVAK